MDLLFVADPLESFKIAKDSTFAMMRAAAARGHRLMACTPRDLMWQSGGPVTAYVRDLSLTGTEAPWFQAAQQAPDERPQPLAEVDAVIMRKDPPFDAEYLYATHLLEQAEREGALVLNRPRALRDHPEKLAILEFPQLIPPTLVTRDAADIRRFHAAHGDLILKPLDGMGGMGIFRVREDGLNLGSIVETLNRHGAQTVMVQRFEPAIAQGDKRILLIEGVAVPWALARIPQGGEVRGNLAAGGKGVVQPLTDTDRRIAETLGPVLAARGLTLVGLDVIGERLTEINVTSPTGFQEITKASGLDVGGLFIDAVERRVQAARAAR